MKMVYTNESSILVSNVKNMLLGHGLPVSVKNEHNSTGGHVLLANMEVWINSDSDYEKAIEVLGELENPQNLKEWVCLGCNEINEGSFEICWNCREERS